MGDAVRSLRRAKEALGVAAALFATGCLGRSMLWIEDGGRTCAAQFGSVCVDATFGADGLFALDLGAADNVDWSCQGMDLQPDGRIVFGGMSAPAAGGALGVIRLDVDGHLDPSFAAAGVALVHLDAGSDVTKVVRVLDGGRILLAGARTAVAGTPITTGLARLLPSGALDPAFGTAGIELIDAGAGADIDIANGALGLANGGLRLAGQQRLPPSPTLNLFVRGLLAQGAPDPSFGAAGAVSIDWFGGDEFGGCVAEGPGGTLLVPGTALHDPHGFDFAVARLLAHGALDPSFIDANALPGRVATDFYDGDDFCAVVIVQAGGKIVCGGYATGPAGRHSALVRYLPSGALDPSFGDGGKLVVAMGADDEVLTLVSLRDGRLVSGGSARNARGDRDFAIAVLSQDGVLDASFGSGGKALLDLSAGRDDGIYALALDALGRLVAFGQTSNGANNDFAVLRLLL